MNRIIKQLIYKSHLECLMCSDCKEPSEIIQLPCKHVFCLLCLETYISENLDVKIPCPVQDCLEDINDPTIRKIMPDEKINEYESLIFKSLEGVHVCLLKECDYVIDSQHQDVQFDCPKCSLYNCISCQKTHKGVTCIQYKKLSENEAKKICDAEMTRAKKEFLSRQIKESRQSIINTNNIDLLTNPQVFECILCLLIIAKGCGVQLRNCFHMICRPCLCDYVINITAFPPKCPNGYCNFSIEDREIKQLLSQEEYEVYTGKSLRRVKPKLSNPFQCQTPNCTYFGELSNPKIKELKCPKCKVVNCIPCKAIHPKEKCADYQKRNVSSTDQKFIESQISSGKCMRCPDCQNLVEKTRGCNWIQCSSCGVELCWQLQMHRWGPKGRGDISGGCKCLVNDIPCHPDCKGCIPHEEGECHLM